jgi:CDGSH-type Zn-finger protein
MGSIHIVENGPYLVTGGIPLYELIIEEDEDGLVHYRPGRTFTVAERYALCRCGQSANMPFCSGRHTAVGFDGTETASRLPYLQRATRYSGCSIDLTDDEDLCAFARFCHAPQGSVWDLTEDAGSEEARAQAIECATMCPAGRLVAGDKATGQAIEPEYEPSIVLLQDPARGCSGPLWVRGGISIYGSDGTCYEVRNRVTLCRCGASANKPFCDAMHVPEGFDDGSL